MCEFVSAVLSNYGGKLRVYVARDLSSHSEAIDFHGLDHGNKSGHNVATVEWTAPDNLDVIVDEDHTRHTYQWYEKWVRRHWATRQDFINDMILRLLKEGHMVWRMAAFKTDWWDYSNTRQYIIGEIGALRDRYAELANDAAAAKVTPNAAAGAAAFDALFKAIAEADAQPIDQIDKEPFCRERFVKIINAIKDDDAAYHFARNSGISSFIGEIFKSERLATGEANDMTFAMEDMYPDVSMDYYGNIEKVRKQMADRLAAAVQKAQADFQQ